MSSNEAPHALRPGGIGPVQRPRLSGARRSQQAEEPGEGQHLVAGSRAKPSILFNYLEHEQDRIDWRATVRLTREIMYQPAMDPYRGEEVRPGEAVRGDEEIDAWVRAAGETAYHPSGTCKIGAPSDPTAVVDPQCKVIGIEGLRVVDASIFPVITNGNLNAPTIMTAEKAADLIRGRPACPCPPRTRRCGPTPNGRSASGRVHPRDRSRLREALNKCAEARQARRNPLKWRTMFSHIADIVQRFLSPHCLTPLPLRTPATKRRRDVLRNPRCSPCHPHSGSWRRVARIARGGTVTKKTARYWNGCLRSGPAALRRGAFASSRWRSMATGRTGWRGDPPKGGATCWSAASRTGTPGISSPGPSTCAPGCTSTAGEASSCATAPCGFPTSPTSGSTDWKRTRLRPRSPPKAPTVTPTWRSTRAAPALVCVRESHLVAAAEAVNALVALPLAGGEARVLHEGRDFYSCPAPSPDGEWLAWMTWDHPSMPWDESVVWLARVRADGSLCPRFPGGGRRRSLRLSTGLVAGRRAAPGMRFAMDGGTSTDGRDEALQPVYEAEAELAHPQWQLGTATYGFARDGSIVASCREAVALAAPAPRRRRGPASALSAPTSSPSGTSRCRATLACCSAEPRTSPGPWCGWISPGARPQSLRQSFAPTLDPAHLSIPRPIDFPTRDGRARPRLLLPARERGLRGAGRRGAAAHRGQPRRADGGGFDDARSAHPVLDEPGIRGARRRLPGQHRIRTRLPRSARGSVGPRRCRGLRQRRPPPGGRGSGGRRAARDPWRQRGRLHHAVRAGVPRRVQGGGEASTVSAISRPSPATPTSSSHATSIGSSDPGPSRRNATGGVLTIHSAERLSCPVIFFQGKRGQGGAAEPGREHGAGAARPGTARGLPRLRRRGPWVPASRHHRSHSLGAETLFLPGESSASGRRENCPSSRSRTSERGVPSKPARAERLGEFEVS